MKKISKLFAVMTILASVLMMCGCGIKNAISQTYDTWYKYSGGPVSVPRGSDTTENDTATSSLDGAEIYVYFNESDGLTVAIQTVTTETVSLAGGLLESDVEIVTGGTKQYTKEQCGVAKWTTLIGFGSFEESKAPKIYTEPEKCVVITDALNNGIQWKKVLKKMLVNKLLGE